MDSIQQRDRIQSEPMALRPPEQARAKEARMFIAGGWFIAVAAVLSHLWVGFGTVVDVTPVVLWSALLIFGVLRVRKHSLWLLLTLPIVLLSSVLRL